MQVAHTGQHGSSTQPANLAKVKQITVMELAVIQAAIEDGVDDLNHNRRGWHTWRTEPLGECSASCIWAGYVRGPHSGWGFVGRIAMLLPSSVTMLVRACDENR